MILNYHSLQHLALTDVAYVKMTSMCTFYNKNVFQTTTSKALKCLPIKTFRLGHEKRGLWTCEIKEDLDQLAHLRSLIIVCTDRMRDL